MNLNQNPTVEELRALLARENDRTGHHVLWVNGAGEVGVTRLPRGYPPPPFQGDDVRVRCETFLAGYEYVGPEAANDREWTAHLFKSLVRAWTQANGSGEPVVIELDRVLSE